MVDRYQSITVNKVSNIKISHYHISSVKYQVSTMNRMQSTYIPLIRSEVFRATYHTALTLSSTSQKIASLWMCHDRDTKSPHMPATHFQFCPSWPLLEIIISKRRDNHRLSLYYGSLFFCGAERGGLSASTGPHLSPDGDIPTFALFFSFSFSFFRFFKCCVFYVIQNVIPTVFTSGLFHIQYS